MLASLIRESRAVRDPGWDLWGHGTDGPNTGNSAAGITVNETTALQSLTVYGCVSYKADAISVLPIDVYKEAPDGSRDEIKPPSWINEPNPDLSGPDLISQAITSLDLDGNFYAIPVRGGNGQVVEIYPLHPQDVQVQRFRPGDRPTYRVFGQTTPPNTVFHVKGFSLPGWPTGLSPIGWCRQAIGSAIAIEEFTGRWFAQGSTPSGIIETEQAADSLNTGMLRDEFEAFHRGIKKSHGIAVLTGGASYKPITISNVDAQFLESKNMSAAQISEGIFRIPPDWVGAAVLGGSRQTYQNIELRWTELVRRAFMPSTNKIQWGFTWKLLPRPWFAEFDFDEYLRADVKTQYDAFGVGLVNGFLTVPDIRKKLRLPQLPEAPIANDAPSDTNVVSIVPKVLPGTGGTQP